MRFFFILNCSQCSVPDGGHVPKSLYMSDEDPDKDLSPVETAFGPDNLYHTAFAVKDYPHEVLIQVPQRGSVVTWDFDVLKGDVTFTVLRCRQTLSASPHEHHISGAVGGIGSTQYTDRHWTVGVDASIVEPPLVCRDGDSIQVSNQYSPLTPFTSTSRAHM